MLLFFIQKSRLLKLVILVMRIVLKTRHVIIRNIRDQMKTNIQIGQERRGVEMAANRKRTVNRKKILIIGIAALLIAAFAFYMFTTPKIILNGDKNMEVTMKDGYKEPGARASFSFDDISKHIKIDSRVNDGKVGSYKVIYTVKYLKKTASKTRIVNVVDKEPPVITLIDGEALSVRPGQEYIEPGFTAVDDSDGDVSEKVKAKGVVDRYNKGDYEIQYTISDSYGNEAKAIRTVTVEGKPVKKVKGVIYLTFDDGPSTNVTPKILNTLEKYDVQATFFIIDYDDDEKKLKLLKRALKDGCTIGVHGYSHVYSKIYSSVPDFIENTRTLEEKIKTDLDYDAFVMRFPGGSSNTVSKAYSKGIMSKLVKGIQKEGFLYNDWNVDSTDASGNNIPVNSIVNSVKKNCNKDTYNVILMHDSDAKETTAEALPEIIKWGIEEGYIFRPMTVNSPTVHHDVNN